MKNLLFLLLLVTVGIGRGTAAEVTGTVKVFILAGQSNMEGQAVVDLSGKDYNEGRGTLVQVMADPARAGRYRHLRDAGGNWVERQDVRVRYQRENQPLLEGPLGPGFSVYGGKHHFGPEWQFGHVMGDFFEEPVLLVKTAWGGKSLYADFRPPGAGGTTGPYYNKMLEEVRAALAAVGTIFPASGGRYELSGLVWYQGWNDGVEPDKAVPEYESNLTHLIRDVRRELGVPDLPVVIGELTGPWVEAPPEWTRLREAQAAVAERPEFAGRVRFVRTRDFVRKAEDSPNPGHGHHEFGNAETIFLTGDALGRGMVDLLRKKPSRTALVREVEGWTLEIQPELWEKEEAAVETAVGLLREQLGEIVRVVPAPAVAELRKVGLWFTVGYPDTPPRAEYHPDAGWLRQNRRDPRMAQGVEFSNIPIFQREMERMPNFALHELAHAWHHRILTYDQPDLKAAFAAAQASGRYTLVEQRQKKARPGKMVRAYALTNVMEYFAEGTEAWFSTNDFYPFTRQELQSYDAQLVEALRKVWAVKP
ncbi:MAG: hypothetical protein JWL81_3095 [Verrucomicrobiales bacterium]|nr:hypothetical protein [Verrucomicrobiales bacterium]